MVSRSNSLLLCLRTAVLAVCLLVLVAGCTAKRTLTQPPRSAIEQRLLAGSIERAAIGFEGPDFEDADVFVEVTGFTQDAFFAREAMASELQTRGAAIVSDPSKADYIVKVLVNAFGIDRSDRFFGVPQMSTFLLPVPEITLFNWIKQNGISRLSVSVVDRRTGRLVGRKQKLNGDTVFNRVTIFPVSFEASDFNEPP
ncbi:MAG TPA: hypothetical protein VGJ57_09865 [Nitrospirales bacterium]